MAGDGAVGGCWWQGWSAALVGGSWLSAVAGQFFLWEWACSRALQSQPFLHEPLRNKSINHIGEPGGNSPRTLRRTNPGADAARLTKKAS